MISSSRVLSPSITKSTNQSFGHPSLSLENALTSHRDTQRWGAGKTKHNLTGRGRGGRRCWSPFFSCLMTHRNRWLSSPPAHSLHRATLLPCPLHVLILPIRRWCAWPGQPASLQRTYVVCRNWPSSGQKALPINFYHPFFVSVSNLLPKSIILAGDAGIRSRPISHKDCCCHCHWFIFLSPGVSGKCPEFFLGRNL